MGWVLGLRVWRGLYLRKRQVGIAEKFKRAKLGRAKFGHDLQNFRPGQTRSEPLPFAPPCWVLLLSLSSCS